MDLKTGIFSLAVGTLLLGSAARAEDTHLATAPEVQTQALRGGSEHTYSWGQEGSSQAAVAPTQQFAYNGQDRRRPQPPAPRKEQGRYELKRVQQWVPGRYEQVWVKKDCRFVAPGYSCPGNYERQWVPGHYETVEQWVWVPAPRRGQGPRWG
ncbi:hypothetical protein [Hyalangium gracile]|uniref:hypothetical protein n=1 Tax=Hyalangium gracile TaxID=394092 RepID=UPI001CCF0E86|nr:hypothetical protein [Hyalangium gracile]